MYRVLIVDDEMPALRFVQSIIERFATNFQVAGVATSGEQGRDIEGQSRNARLYESGRRHHRKWRR